MRPEVPSNGRTKGDLFRGEVPGNLATEDRPSWSGHRVHQVAVTLASFLGVLAILVGPIVGCGSPAVHSDAARAEAAQAIDWDLLFQQRDGAGNDERDAVLSAGPIRIAGYLVPIDEFALDQQVVGLSTFLLVPYHGACIHFPPPPPDQMIFVEMADGQEVPLDLWSWDPVEIAGDLREEAVDSLYGDVGYRMAGIASRAYGGGWDAVDGVLEHQGFEEML